jgi:hypothetical protein
MRIRRTVAADVIPPRFYGLGYRRVHNGDGVFYVMPVHLFVRYARDFWFRFKFGADLCFREQIERDLLELGYKRGRRELAQNLRRTWAAFGPDRLVDQLLTVAGDGERAAEAETKDGAA